MGISGVNYHRTGLRDENGSDTDGSERNPWFSLCFFQRQNEPSNFGKSSVDSLLQVGTGVYPFISFYILCRCSCRYSYVNPLSAGVVVFLHVCLCIYPSGSARLQPAVLFPPTEEELRPPCSITFAASISSISRRAGAWTSGTGSLAVVCCKIVPGKGYWPSQRQSETDNAELKAWTALVLYGSLLSACILSV